MQSWKQRFPDKNNRIVLLGGVVIAIVVAVTYYSGLSVGFWSDDYAFLETAARLPLSDYLAWYFDPRLQALWYRPIPGMLWWVEWHIFYGNALGYHLVYVLIHLASCLLIYAIVAQVLKDWLAGFASALAYAGISVYSLAVLRPSDETALAAFFYLLTVFCWLNFLVEQKEWQRLLTYTSFVLALLSKEASVTLPVILFLMDVLLIGDKNQIAQWVRRYWLFALVLIPYLALEITIAPNTEYRTNLGYGFGLHMIPVLGDYLTWLAFPWGLDPPLNYLWLAIVFFVLAFVITTRRDRRWLFLVVGALVICAPYVPFQFFFMRFLYLPMMLSAIAIGSTLAWLHKRFASQRWQTVLLTGGLACIVTVNALGTMGNSDWLTRFAREGRIPLRTISQWHSSLPEDTLLYFINPPVPLYGGMFYLRYGPQVSTAGDIGTYKTIWRNVLPEIAGLRNHNAAFVYYFDGGEIKEQRVSKQDNAGVDPTPPVNFQSLITLEGYEIASAQVKRGEAVLVLLYWRAEEKLGKDYTVFAHLLDKNGDRVTGMDSQPRSGNSRTSSWRVGDRIVDWIILPISDQVTPGTDFRLEFGLYDQTTMQRLQIVDAAGHAITDHLVIAPLSIVK